jgi:hypothetical protein
MGSARGIFLMKKDFATDLILEMVLLSKLFLKVSKSFLSMIQLTVHQNEK